MIDDLDDWLSEPPHADDARRRMAGWVAGLVGAVVLALSVSVDWLGIGPGSPGVGRLQVLGAVLGVGLVLWRNRVAAVAGRRFGNDYGEFLRTAIVVGAVAAFLTVALVANALLRAEVVCAECYDQTRPASGHCGEAWNPTTAQPGDFPKLGCSL